MIITPHSSITTRLISTKLHILCPPYTQFYLPNLKKIGSVAPKIFVPKNSPILFTFFFFKGNLSQIRTIELIYFIVMYQYGTWGLPLIKMTTPQNTVNVLRPGHLLSKILILSTSGGHEYLFQFCVIFTLSFSC